MNDREPLRPRAMEPGTWAYRVSRARPLRWFLVAFAAFSLAMFVAAAVHHWWWLMAVGGLGATLSLLQFRDTKRKAARENS
jgi:uncharacterized membrane protein YjjB (DUF3815 family)